MNYYKPASAIGKKTLRLVEASIPIVVARLGHKASPLRTWPIRNRNLEYSCYFQCELCYKPEPSTYTMSGVNFFVEMPVGDEYFHLYAVGNISGKSTGKVEIAILDKQGEDAMFKRDLPKQLYCLKYQNLG